MSLDPVCSVKCASTCPVLTSSTMITMQYMMGNTFFVGESSCRRTPMITELYLLFFSCSNKLQNHQKKKKKLVYTTGIFSASSDTKLAPEYRSRFIQFTRPSLISQKISNCCNSDNRCRFLQEQRQGMQLDFSSVWVCSYVPTQ